MVGFPVEGVTNAFATLIIELTGECERTGVAVSVRVSAVAAIAVNIFVTGLTTSSAVESPASERPEGFRRTPSTAVEFTHTASEWPEDFDPSLGRVFGDAGVEVALGRGVHRWSLVLPQQLLDALAPEFDR